MLSEMGHAPDDDYAAVLAVLRKLQKRVQAEFGEHFMMINDFFSYRSNDRRMLLETRARWSKR